MCLSISFNGLKLPHADFSPGGQPVRITTVVIPNNNPKMLETAYKLPLNKTKMREDTEYMIALLKEDNGKLLPLEAGEILNPTLTLWMAVMLRYSPYGRKLDGWAKKIDEDQIKEITRVSSASSRSASYDKNTIFMNKVLYHTWYGNESDLYSYNIGGIVSEKDEYINYLLDTAILEYLKNRINPNTPSFKLSREHVQLECQIYSRSISDLFTEYF